MAKSMDKVTLIILNGGSSAGKTSLGKRLQDILPHTYLSMARGQRALVLAAAQATRPPPGRAAVLFVADDIREGAGIVQDNDPGSGDAGTLSGDCLSSGSIPSQRALVLPALLASSAFEPFANHPPN